MALVNTTVAARVLGVTRIRVVQLIRLGHLQAQKIGRDWLIDEKTLNEFASRKRPAGRPKKPKKKS
jgi:excisionase family DNA binding protein